MNVTYTDYEAFFEDLARNHTNIKHEAGSNKSIKRFFTLNIAEIAGDMRSNIDVDTTVMVLEKYDHDSKDEHSDNFLKEYHAAVMILKKCNQNDYEQQSQALTLCESIVNDIEDRIYSVSIGEEGYEDQFFTNVEVSQFNTSFVGPLFNGLWFGARLMFHFSATKNRTVDTAKWADLP